MKVTIRQLNGCLSAMQVAKINSSSQKILKELIQLLIENKKDSVEMPTDDNFCKAIIDMSKLHKSLVNVQKRF